MAASGINNYTLFYKQHHAGIGGKKAKSNILLTPLKIIRFLHPYYHSKMVGHVLKNVQKTKWVCFERLCDKKFNNKKACVIRIRTVRLFYSSIIKHVRIFQGVIWHVQQNFVKCFIIPLPRFSYIIYWLIHFNVPLWNSICLVQLTGIEEFSFNFLLLSLKFLMF